MNCSFEVAVSEMHIIAYCYHWDVDSLWNMHIKERKMWVNKILEQKEAENRSISESK